MLPKPVCVCVCVCVSLFSWFVSLTAFAFSSLSQHLQSVQTLAQPRGTAAGRRGDVWFGLAAAVRHSIRYQRETFSRAQLTQPVCHSMKLLRKAPHSGYILLAVPDNDNQLPPRANATSVVLAAAVVVLVYAESVSFCLPWSVASRLLDSRKPPGRKPACTHTLFATLAYPCLPLVRASRHSAGDTHTHTVGKKTIRRRRRRRRAGSIHDDPC